MTIIGIDPPKGFAVSKDGKLVEVRTLDFWGCIKELERYRNSGDSLLVYIENPCANKSLYAKFDKYKHSIRNRIAQSVGGNKSDTKRLMDWMDAHAVEYIPVPPRRGNLTKNGKGAAEYFCRLTGCTKRTSEHGRDAAMLFWGRSYGYDLTVKRAGR